MMLKFKPFDGPLRHVFKDPDTGREFSAADRPSLITQILRYREQNSLPLIDALAAVLENYLCQLPENQGRCTENTSISRSWYQYLQGGVMLLKNMAFPEFAKQEIADERSSQCMSCPHNTFPDRGPFLKFSDEIAVMSVGERKSKHHNDIGNCGVCSCALRGKVFWAKPLPVFKEEELVQLRKVKCWQLKLSGQEER